MQPSQNDVLIELHVPDFEKVKEFYGKLGFKVVWERKPEAKKGYLVMRRGDSILCFWPGNEQVWNQDYFKSFPKTTKRGYALEIIIMVDNIEELYGEAKLFANVVEEIGMRPWGLKDFRIEDPFGFYLRFTAPHDIVDSNNAVD